MKHVPVAVRFWSHVAKSDGCWLWTGAPDFEGYGRIKVGPRRMIGAHRCSLQLAIGRELTTTERALHRCDVRLCVRPDHLYVGDATDNMRDAIERGLWRARGSSNGRSKLNEQQVLEIRAALSAGARQKDLAEKYGVSRQPIWLIAHGKNWKHVARLP